MSGNTAECLPIPEVLMNDEKNRPDDDKKMTTNEQTRIAPFTDGNKSGSDEIEISAAELKDILSDELTDDDMTIMGEDADADPHQDTVLSENEFDRAKEDTIIEDKTSVMFSITDIQQKLNKEISEIPDNYQEQFEPEQMSMVIKDYFTHRSDAEKVKINRNFLKDAEPFQLDRLIDEIKKSPEGLHTGFRSLDNRITIPPDAVTIIAARPKHGKTCFILNILLNLCRQYPEKHFIFYTYESPKWEIMLKLINISGSKQFDLKQRFLSNLDYWKYEFKHTNVDSLKEKTGKVLEYSGLKYFMQISPKIHVIDSNHNIIDLVDSIHSFGKAFDVGAVFIDSLPKVQVEKERNSMDRFRQLQEISDRLKKAAYETRFPLIISAPLTRGAVNSPEYDDLSEANLTESGSPGRDASLVIGLQNYARSKFIGSNLNPNFKSTFYGQPLPKAEVMPENFKDMMQKTILLAKVITNKIGPEPETELVFHKQLLKITDFQDESGGM
jgi:replicative DNA helicase